MSRSSKKYQNEHDNADDTTFSGFDDYELSPMLAERKAEEESRKKYRLKKAKRSYIISDD